jgi:hypothetical protein
MSGVSYDGAISRVSALANRSDRHFENYKFEGSKMQNGENNFGGVDARLLLIGGTGQAFTLKKVALTRRPNNSSHYSKEDFRSSTDTPANDH